MAVSYKRLWKLLVDKKMSKSDLRKKAEIAHNTMTKLCRDEEVSLTILSKICKTLNVDFGDIVEYVPDVEIWDLYNENRELLGKDHIRGEQLPIDGYHLVVNVWIRNSKGEYLISQRSANRPTYPLMWECVGGSVVKGEDSLRGAIREVKEEIGVELSKENGQVLFTKTRKIIDGKIFNDIMDVWLFEYDGEVDLGNATTDEVAQVAWMNREQIKELFDANMFVDTLKYFFNDVDKMERNIMRHNTTLSYYDNHADEFYKSTVNVEFDLMQEYFLKKMKEGSYILDFGCGSGRDTKYFLQQGYKVDAVDGSKELCKLASEYTGIEVKKMVFQELTEVEKYDGIWACSSILHLPIDELAEVMRKMVFALKEQGIIYTSFKYGTFTGERNGRFFTDMTEATFADFLSGIDGLEVEGQWITSDVRPGRGEEKWLNLILRKK